MRITRRGRLAATCSAVTAAGLSGVLVASAFAPPDTGSDAAPPAQPVTRASEAVTTAATPVAVAPDVDAGVAARVVPPAPPGGLDDADVAAGLTSRAVPDAGTGDLVVVPGSSPPPEGAARVRTLRVEVEDGLGIDGARFAETVMTTLNDPRGWVAVDGSAFARTDGDADVRVVLASPQLSEQMCRPLRTRGTLSCRNGDAAVLTLYRWVEGTREYREQADLATYRTYVVNHEVGHLLGYGHVRCPEPGQPAPVMLQQTIGLQGCTPNAYPAITAG